MIEINNAPPTSPSIPSMKLMKFIIAVKKNIIKITITNLKYVSSRLSKLNKKLPAKRILDEVIMWKKYLKKEDTLKRSSRIPIKNKGMHKTGIMYIFE